MGSRPRRPPPPIPRPRRRNRCRHRPRPRSRRRSTTNQALLSQTWQYKPVTAALRCARTHACAGSKFKPPNALQWLRGKCSGRIEAARRGCVLACLTVQASRTSHPVVKPGQDSGPRACRVNRLRIVLWRPMAIPGARKAGFWRILFAPGDSGRRVGPVLCTAATVAGASASVAPLHTAAFSPRCLNVAWYHAYAHSGGCGSGCPAVAAAGRPRRLVADAGADGPAQGVTRPERVRDSRPQHQLPRPSGAGGRLGRVFG